MMGKAKQQQQQKKAVEGKIVPNSVFSEEEQIGRKNPEKENLYCRIFKCKSLYQTM